MEYAHYARAKTRVFITRARRHTAPPVLVPGNDGGGGGALPLPATDADVEAIESDPGAERLLTLTNALRWSRVKRAVGGDGSRSSVLPVRESSTPPACGAPRSMRRRGGAPT